MFSQLIKDVILFLKMFVHLVKLPLLDLLLNHLLLDDLSIEPSVKTALIGWTANCNDSYWLICPLNLLLFVDLSVKSPSIGGYVCWISSYWMDRFYSKPASPIDGSVCKISSYWFICLLNSSDWMDRFYSKPASPIGLSVC